jgi:hypothetical protein
VVVKTCIGINSFAAGNTVSAYPSPASSHVTVSSGAIPSAIQVLNIAGQPVMDCAVQGHRSTLDISKLADGVYFIKVQTGRDPARYLKIVKQ